MNIGKVLLLCTGLPCFLLLQADKLVIIAEVWPSAEIVADTFCNSKLFVTSDSYSLLFFIALGSFLSLPFRGN